MIPLPTPYLFVNLGSNQLRAAVVLTRYPDEVCDILAQYEWGGLRHTTQKEFKNLKKKTSKKAASAQQSMKRVHHDQPILLHFD